MPVANYGRLTNLITGIQGVSAGGQASINMAVNQRIHGENFQCTGIAWDAATKVTVVGSSGGAGAVLTPTIVNGVITAVAITNGGSAYAGTITVSVADGVYGTNLFAANITATQSAGAINSVTIVSGGVVSPVPVERFFTSFKHLVNGTIIRDISAQEILSLALANNELPFTHVAGGVTDPCAGTTNGTSFPWLSGVYNSSVEPYVIGQLPIYMTEPWRKIVSHDSATSWDLFGQSTYQILAGITANITSPGLVGTYDFDYLRNATRNQNGTAQLFLKPVKQHSFTFNVPAGMYDVTTLPVTFPIQRLWIYSASTVPYQVELYADGNKVLEGTAEQVKQVLRDYNFNTIPFNLPCIFDKNQRLGDALKIARTLDVRVWNTNAGAMTVLMESTPPAYA